jgi:hypothetical protein
VRELESLIKSSRPKGLRRKIGQMQNEPLVAILEEQMQHALATKVRIIKRKKRGHINIDFYSSEDLERIASVIKGGGK